MDQEDIAGFLSISQLLKIKGLTNNQENRSQEVKNISMRSDMEDEHFVSKKQMKREHSENPQNHCSECGKYFITSSILKMHSMSHEAVESADDPLSERSATSETTKPLSITSEKVQTNNEEIENNVESLIDGDTDSEMVEDETKSLSLHNMLKGIIECDNGVWKCKVCGKICKSQVPAKEHGEIHIEGLRYPCVECGKSLKTSVAMRQHMKRWHKAAK